MKVAILLSGHTRSFERCLPTLHWHVFRHFPGADFFISTVKDADAPKADLLRVKYPGARVEIDVVDEQPDCVAEMRAKGVDLPKEWTRGKSYTHEPYPISVHPQGVLRQLWQLQKCWELFSAKRQEWQDVLDYDVIIRCRPDLWFHSATLTRTETVNTSTGFSWASVGLVQGSREAFLPYWGQFGGVNDRFALLGCDAASAYFQTYSRIHELTQGGCPLHPESLVAASLERAHVITNTLFAEFSTLRNNGEMRGPEITTIDLARLHA